MDTLDGDLMALFKRLALSPSPSNFETKTQIEFRNYIEGYVDECRFDVQGNLIAYRKGRNGKKVMLIAHCDEIGFIVNYIDNDGFLSFLPIGGVDRNSLQGYRVVIIHNDKLIPGIIGKRRSSDNSSNREINIEDFWIDIGANSKEEATQMVNIGDYITFDPNFTEFPNDRIVCKSADNRSGMVVMAGVLKEISTIGTDVDLYIVSSVQEEVGMRGAKTAAFEVKPDVCIVLDVTFASDYPTINKSLFADIKLNSGPVISFGAHVNNKLQACLKEIAIDAGIECQVSAMANSSGTDAGIVQISRNGILTGLICIPCRYMHSPIEMVSKKDINASISLIKAFLNSEKWKNFGDLSGMMSNLY